MTIAHVQVLPSLGPETRVADVVIPDGLTDRKIVKLCLAVLYLEDAYTSMADIYARLDREGLLSFEGTQDEAPPHVVVFGGSNRTPQLVSRQDGDPLKYNLLPEVRDRIRECQVCVILSGGLYAADLLLTYVAWSRSSRAGRWS